MSRTTLPILWLCTTLIYSVLVAPLFLTVSRPGGPLISVLGALTPFVLSLVGVVLGATAVRHQSVVQQVVTFILILGGTAVIGLVLVHVFGVYRMGRYRVFGL
ncbi:MAG: hypothetical protein WD009_05745 [Phycisphaeraceae bacterium]